MPVVHFLDYILNSLWSLHFWRSGIAETIAVSQYYFNLMEILGLIQVCWTLLIWTFVSSSKTESKKYPGLTMHVFFWLDLWNHGRQMPLEIMYSVPSLHLPSFFLLSFHPSSLCLSEMGMFYFSNWNKKNCPDSYLKNFFFLNLHGRWFCRIYIYFLNCLSDCCEKYSLLSCSIPKNLWINQIWSI